MLPVTATLVGGKAADGREDTIVDRGCRRSMTPFALSRLMPLPFWPVPPASARMWATRFWVTIVPSSPSSSRETRMPVLPQSASDVAACPHHRATDRAAGRPCRSTGRWQFSTRPAQSRRRAPAPPLSRNSQSSSARLDTSSASRRPASGSASGIPAPSKRQPLEPNQPGRPRALRRSQSRCEGQCGSGRELRRCGCWSGSAISLTS